MLENLLGIRLLLKMGRPKQQLKPAPYEVITALTNIQVTDDAKGRDGFQMTFTLGKSQAKDYSLMGTGLFEPKARVAIVLQIGARLEPLISGVIDHFQLEASNEPGMSTLSVSGQGIVSQLGLEEKNASYRNQADSSIITQIISRAASYGLALQSAAKQTEQPDQNRRVPRQFASDLEYIEYLAERNGFVFYSQPTASGDVKVYWGPENRRGTIQPALTVNMGPSTNVTRLSFSLDCNAPVKTKGARMQVEKKNARDEQVVPPTQFDVDDLAATEVPGEQLVLMRDVAKHSTSEAQLKARGLLMKRFDTVTGSGEVDTVRYGYILRAGKLVAVRGAGALYNGVYYVSSVTHTIEPGRYTQSFQLKREGRGAKKEKVPS